MSIKIRGWLHTWADAPDGSGSRCPVIRLDSTLKCDGRGYDDIGALVTKDLGTKVEFSFCSVWRDEDEFHVDPDTVLLGPKKLSVKEGKRPTFSEMMAQFEINCDLSGKPASAPLFATRFGSGVVK